MTRDVEVALRVNHVEVGQQKLLFKRDPAVMHYLHFTHMFNLNVFW